MKKLLVVLLLFGALAHAQAPVIHYPVDPVSPNCIDTRLIFSDATNNVFIGKAGACTQFSSGAGSGMAIGGTVTGGTAGSVLFVGAGPVLSQDNANLFWDSTNKFISAGPQVGFSGDADFYRTSGSQVFTNLNTVTATMASNSEAYGLVGVFESTTTPSLLNQGGLLGISQGGVNSISTHFIGVSGVAENNGGSGASSFIGIRGATIQLANAGAALNSLISVQADSAFKSAGTTPTDVYGVKVEDQTAGVNNYGIRTGRGKVELGDVLQLDGGSTFGSSETHAAAACEANYAATAAHNGTTTITTGLNCLPANSIIDAVVYRITNTLSGNSIASFTVGVAGSTSRFCGTQSTLTTGTTGICFAQADQTGAAGPRQVSAAAVVVTENQIATAGDIRLIVYYHTWTAPTS